MGGGLSPHVLRKALYTHLHIALHYEHMGLLAATTIPALPACQPGCGCGGKAQSPENSLPKSFHDDRADRAALHG